MITRYVFEMEVVVDGDFECDVAQAIKTTLEGETIATTVRESELLNVIIDEVCLEPALVAGDAPLPIREVPAHAAHRAGRVAHVVHVHYDEQAPRQERYRVLESEDGAPGSRWRTVQSFPTRREADAFARGYWKGSRRVA